MMLTMTERLKWVLHRMTPDNNPLLWLILNFICFFTSLILIFVELRCEDDSTIMKFAVRSYLVYDLFTTIVWVIETAMELYTAGQVDNDFKIEFTRSNTVVVLHMLFAVLFLWDSIIAVCKWKAHEDIDILLISVFINAIVYFSACLDTYSNYRNRVDYTTVFNEFML